MKNLSALLLFLFAITLQAQIPAGYYDQAEGLTGYELKTKLSQITGQGYIENSYGSLWGFLAFYDVDVYYENDGTLLDIYSENPDGIDPYTYYTVSDQCGNYSAEGDCYNREHLMPQSWFSNGYPMRTDIHHIYPTDGYVNNMHGNMPLGEVNNPVETSLNGSKRGQNSYNYPGAFNGQVFEPIDAFKGDIARAYLYMAVRYENQIAGWNTNSTEAGNTFNGTSDQVFNDWTLSMLIKWHEEDPVSQREIDRNDGAYLFQGNRNPFIDHPEFVQMIWGNQEQPGDVLFAEDFESCTIAGNHFVAVSEMSAADWECVSDTGRYGSGAMQMTGKAGGEEVSSLDWLITSSAMNLDNLTDGKLSLYVASEHGNTPLSFLYSQNYDGGDNPSDFEWLPVPGIDIPVYPMGTSGTVETSFIQADISLLSGENVYFAFKYDNTGGETATHWVVDDFAISGFGELLSTPKIKQPEVVLYPNPTPNAFVHIELAGVDAFEYSVYDMTGHLVYSGKNIQNSSPVFLGNLTHGMYFVKIDFDRHSVVKKVIIK